MSDMVVVLFLVVLIALVAYITYTAAEQRKQLIAETTKSIDRSYEQQRFMMDAFVEKLDKANIGTASMLQNTAIHTVEAITKVMMAELMPVAMPRVEQARLPAEGDPLNPIWTQWEDQNEGREDFGVGDSVVLDREQTDRVAMIEEGVMIVPGVPMRDMSGEDFDG